MVHDAIKPPLVALYRGYKEIDSRRQDFDRWREARPFWGGVMLAVGGLIAGYTPYIVLTDWLFRSGSARLIGVLGSFFATAVVLCGIGALINPELSNLLGMVGITFTILATLVGNFGGLLIGTFLGIIGGALLIAWRRVDVYDRRRRPASEGGESAAPPRDRQTGGRPGRNEPESGVSPEKRGSRDTRDERR